MCTHCDAVAGGEDLRSENEHEHENRKEHENRQEHEHPIEPEHMSDGELEDEAGDGGAAGRQGPPVPAGTRGPAVVCRPTPPAPVRRPVPVVVRSTDPLSREGATSLLGRLSAVQVIDGADTPPGTVTVTILDVLDDTSMPRLRRLLGADEAHVVLVVGEIGEEQLLDVVAGGVSAILWRRQVTPERLLHAVLAVARGDADIPHDLMGHLLAQVGRLRRAGPGEPGGPDQPQDGLTTRETDVLRLLADGMDTDQVARKLGCSTRTVKSVLHGMTTRLGLNNRTHAVAYALRGGHVS
ncbi:helix-turn-helix transcriptional regulator [Streptomyces cavernae]|uniref:helix-turn-helix transcriptional regulator n=1 Tax=Streptomyces cavernae TaxID=2259034 RepID=UPI001EE46AA7|nr:response regulator transcription factor [Streptomyces cavernae]